MCESVQGASFDELRMLLSGSLSHTLCGGFAHNGFTLEIQIQGDGEMI